MLRTIEVSHRTIIFTISLLVVVWVLVQLVPIIITIFIALLLTTALNPIVDRLTHLKIPRALAIVLVYLVLIGIIVASLSSIISPLLGQTTDLVNRLPELFDQLGKWLSSLGIPGVNGDLLATQVSQLGTLPGSIINFFIFLFSNIIAVVTVLVITFYMLLERKNLDKYVLVLFGRDREKQAKIFIDRLEARLGGWVGGELILMFTIGLMTYAGLRILGLSYALPLAIIAGVLEILPNIGPIVSSIPGILVGLSVSPIMGLGVAALYFLIHQLENTLIVPNVMRRAAGVNPLVTIISLAIGFKLGGTTGAILAVPIVIIIRGILVDVFGFHSLQKIS